MIPGTESVIAEVVALLVVVNLVFVARIASRRILLGGFLKFKSDDWLMTFAVVCFEFVMAAIWITCLWGNNYNVTQEMVDESTPELIDQMIKGSKWAIAMETLKVTCVWCCKGCLLILYASMTKGVPKYNKAVKIVSVYVVVGYIVVMVCYFTAWCRPFTSYWALPVPEGQSECMSYRKHMLMDAAWNITSDAVMLCLPLPFLIRSRVTLTRKLVLCGIFGLGIFVILCAILNRVTNFTYPLGSWIYLNWYAGETATAVIVANVPHLWPLISRVFNLGSFKASSGPSASNQYPLRSKSGGVGIPSARSAKHDMDGYIPTDSEEKIAHNGAKDSQWGYGKGDNSPSTNEDVETGNGYMQTKIRGGNPGHNASTGIAVQDTRLGGWEDDRGDAGRKGQIVKTVQINQTHSDYTP